MNMTTPTIVITPRFPGAPKKKTTLMDFMVEVRMPAQMLVSSVRNPINTSIAIDVSGSMDDPISQEVGLTTPGFWQLRPISFFKPGVRGWDETLFGGCLIQGGVAPRSPWFPQAPEPLQPGAAPAGQEYVWVPPTTSGGRKYSKMDRAIEGACAAVDALSAQDRISVVAFSSSAYCVFASAYATPSNKEKCKAAIRQLRASGGTAMLDGWRLAAEQVCNNIEHNTVNRVLLLTDGEAMPKDRAQLAEHAMGLVEHNVTTSTFGIGLHFNEDLLLATAESGDGRYYYLDNPHQVAEKFAEEFSGLSQLLGRDVRLCVTTGPGVTPTACLNELPEKDGSYILPNAVRGHDQKVILRGHVEGTPTDGWSLTATLKWKDSDGLAQSSETIFCLPVVTDKAFASMTEDSRVGERSAELEIAQTKKAAIAALDAGNRELSGTLMGQTMAMASGSAYDSVRSQGARLTSLRGMMESGNTHDFRKSALSDAYNASKGFPIVGD
jgi:Ca-activated chloride channel family protein